MLEYIDRDLCQHAMWYLRPLFIDRPILQEKIVVALVPEYETVGPTLIAHHLYGHRVFRHLRVKIIPLKPGKDGTYYA
jgi:hypothetical protein